jgi:hypothetical protein
MIFAWLSLDLVLVVLFAAALPITFLFLIRRWLGKAESGQDQNPPPGK